MTKIVSFNIESESQLRERARVQRKKKQEDHRVSVNFKYGTIRFGTRYIEDNHLEGKLIKLYVDASRTKILWCKLDESAGFSSIEVLKEYRMIKASITNTVKQYSMSVPTFLRASFPIEVEQGNVVRKALVQSCIINHMNKKQFDYVDIR